MRPHKAYSISIILAGAGIISLLLPFFGGRAEDQQGFLFLGFLLVLGAFMFRQLGEEKNNDRQ